MSGRHFWPRKHRLILICIKFKVISLNCIIWYSHCGQWFDIIPFLIGVLGGEDWEWRDIWHYITEGWDEFTVFIVLFYIYIFSESPLERMWGELKKNEESQGQHEQHVQKERGIKEPKKVTHRLEEVIENLEVSIEII